MSSLMDVRPAQIADFTEVLDVLNISFRSKLAEHPSFDVLLPDLYRPDVADMANLFVVRERSRIVSIVGLFPLPLVMDGRAIEIGGIGGVCTLPEYRGKNLMQRIMDCVMDEMARRGYPFGWLSGDRRRYQPWGFEFCKINYNLMLGLRGPGFEKYTGTISGSIQEGRVDNLDWPLIWRQTENQSQLRACGQEKLRLKYRRLNHKVYMTENAHILVRDIPTDRHIMAYGGEPATVAALAAERIQSEGKEIEVTVPAYPYALENPFNDLMIHYSLGYGGAIAILDLAKTFSIFQNHLNRRVADLGLRGTVRLVMWSPGHKQAQEVFLEADGFGLNIRSGGTGNGATIEMTCHEMVSLLFSPLSQVWMNRLNRSARWLAVLAPLPVFIPPLYHV